MNRREFLDLLWKASLASGLSGCSRNGNLTDANYYAWPAQGEVRVLHITDTHAQLLPIHFREPNVNIGIGGARGRFPHLVGKNLLAELPNATPRDRHAFTHLDFTESAERFGKVGGFAHLKTLLDQLSTEGLLSLLNKVTARLTKIISNK